MTYLIFDLEATCWKDKSNGKPNEIIEIGAVKIDQSGTVLGEFSEFVRPKLNPVLSDFCRELTTITQAEVDEADAFSEVLGRFQQWVDIGNPYVLCSWGFYDRKQLTKDCQLHGLDTGWLSSHISLKHQYAEIRSLSRPVGMKTALQKEGIPLTGTHHRGIDDARNIAQIFLAQLPNWRFPHEQTP